jgi:hypothetical protein
MLVVDVWRCWWVVEATAASVLCLRAGWPNGEQLCR